MTFRASGCAERGMAEPSDAQARRAVAPVVVYPPAGLPPIDMALLHARRKKADCVQRLRVPARDGRCFSVPAGAFFRVLCVEGPQVGDLNLWNAHDLKEFFYSGKTRALHGTHVGEGERLWSSLPHLRPMATMTCDRLAWYGRDEHGCRVHDVIGTRCDPYTGRLLSGDDYHFCCHSNLTRALASWTGLGLRDAEVHVHDVLNLFMCTGFHPQTGRYQMKASPVRAGDFVEFYAEIDLLVGLSACPGGDCSATHSSNEASCFPLGVEIYDPGVKERRLHRFPVCTGYDGTHGSGL